MTFCLQNCHPNDRYLQYYPSEQCGFLVADKTFGVTVMRSFAAYIIYFRGDQQLDRLVRMVEEDEQLHGFPDHDQQYRHLISNPAYKEYQMHVDVLYSRYLKNLKVVVR